MNKKTIFQVFLVSLFLLLSIFFYLNYFYKKDSKLLLKQNEIADTDFSDSLDGTTIKEILYESYDNEGNKFTIKSKSGAFDDNKENETVPQDEARSAIEQSGIFAVVSSMYAITLTS